MLIIDSDDTTPTVNANNVSNGSSDFSFEYDPQAELDSFIFGDGSNKHNTDPSDIDFILDNYNPEPIKSREDIFQYWESRKNDEKVLYKLAMAILSIPAMEVQIERDFSNLNFIFSDRRCRLEHERLEDIMVINLNKELFEEVKEEELQELLRQQI